jgi:hypothetical protein
MRVYIIMCDKVPYAVCKDESYAYRRAAILGDTYVNSNFMIVSWEVEE